MKKAVMNAAPEPPAIPEVSSTDLTFSALGIDPNDDWQMLGATMEGAYEYAVSSIKRDGDLTRVWTRSYFLAPLQLGPGRPNYQSCYASYVVDCQRHLMAIEETLYYADAYFTQPVGAYKDHHPDFAAAIPGSVAAAIVKVLSDGHGAWH